jgi:cytochrome c-type biogenesis protein CcmH/NrfF
VKYIAAAIMLWFFPVCNLLLGIVIQDKSRESLARPIFFRTVSHTGL